MRQSARVRRELAEAPLDLTRVVLADDDRFFLEMMRTALSDCGEFEVVATAENGSDAIACVEEFEPELVLMDVAMPVLDGVQATRRIRELPDPPAVILITGDDAEADAAAYEAGACAYLRKAKETSLLVGALMAVVLREAAL